MKKRLPLLLIALALSLCASADPISPERAREIASRYSRLGSQPQRVRRSAEVAQQEDEQQNVYVFNRGRNQGIVIVSGDDRLPEVLGYTEGGDYDEELMPPALKGYIEHYAKQVAELQQNASLSHAPVKAPVYDKDIKAMLTTDWVQGSPYNNMCPFRKDGGGRALVGCVATATSQIAYYWGKQGYCNRMTAYDTPTYGYGDAPVTTSIPAGTPLRWELMGSTSSPANKEALATLNFVMGVSAWLTYGSSTGGYIWNEIGPMHDHLGLNGGVRKDRYQYSNEDWMRICAQDLAAGHPILYSGYTEDNSGHAFVMDGYQMTDNKFHFNYGWGAGWDGFFTLDDCRGYGNGQIMVYQISPVDLSIVPDYDTPETFYYNARQQFKLTVTNDGKNSVNGIYLIASDSKTNAPVSLENAISCSSEVLKPGQSVELECTHTPRASSEYLFVVDKRCRVLHSQLMNYSVSSSRLALMTLGLEQEIANVQERELAGSTVPVSQITDTEVNVLAGVLNSSATPCSPSITFELHKYNPSANAFTKVGSTTRYYEFEAGGQSDVRTHFDLEAKTTYKIVVSKTVLSPRCTMNFDTHSDAYYIETIGDPLTSVVEGTKCTVTGTYGNIAMQKILADSTITVYDMTAVSGLKANIDTMLTNPNALIYVNSETELPLCNLLKGDECAQLELTPGNDYAADARFTAAKATMNTVLNDKTTWGILLAPFDCEVPDGMLVREMTALSGRYITEFNNGVTSIKAGVPYLYKQAEAKQLVASNVSITTDKPASVLSILMPLYANTDITTLPGSKAYVLGKNSFLNQTSGVIPAFTAYTTALVYLDNRRPQELIDMDVQNEILLDSLSSAYSTVNSYREIASPAALAALQLAIEKAEHALTVQESAAAIEKAIEDLFQARTHFLDDPTSISDIEMDGEKNRPASDVYDLTGRKVDAPARPGIYVVNGRRVLVK